MAPAQCSSKLLVTLSGKDINSKENHASLTDCLRAGHRSQNQDLLAPRPKLSGMESEGGVVEAPTDPFVY